MAGGFFDWDALTKVFAPRPMTPGFPSSMEYMTDEPPKQKQAPQQRGWNQEQANTFDEVQEGLMQMATAFRQPGEVQPLPSPYTGAGFRGHPNIGQEGLMGLLQYLTSQGGGQLR